MKIDDANNVASLIRSELKRVRTTTPPPAHDFVYVCTHAALFGSASNKWKRLRLMSESITFDPPAGRPAARLSALAQYSVSELARLSLNTSVLSGERTTVKIKIIIPIIPNLSN